MYYNNTMSASFEAEKNRKAFTYTAAIVAALLLLAIFWTWTILPTPPPVAQDLIEINLGNLSEGFGEVQPLIKGDKSPGDLSPFINGCTSPKPSPKLPKLISIRSCAMGGGVGSIVHVQKIARSNNTATIAAV